MSLYGTRDAAANWQKLASTTMQQLGLHAPIGAGTDGGAKGEGDAQHDAVDAETRVEPPVANTHAVTERSDVKGKAHAA